MGELRREEKYRESEDYRSVFSFVPTIFDRHIMLAHPFDAPSRREAEDMEKQALGRINRIGQEASSLVLWRIVTEGTIEQELHERAGEESPAKRSRKK